MVNETNNNGTAVRKPVLFIQHGLTADASRFVINAPFKAPAFMAVKDGFDVWLGNNRGNRYSLGHAHLKHDDKTPEYWDFDFEEMGLYDLPAMFNYTLNYTGASKLSMIGHS